MTSFNVNANEWNWAYENDWNAFKWKSNCYCNMTLKTAIGVMPIQQPYSDVMIVHKSGRMFTLKDAKRLIKIQQL